MKLIVRVGGQLHLKPISAKEKINYPWTNVAPQLRSYVMLPEKVKNAHPSYIKIKRIFLVFQFFFVQG